MAWIKVLVRRYMGLKKIWVRKIIRSKKNWVLKNLESKFWFQKIWGRNKFGVPKRGYGYKGLWSLLCCHFFKKFSNLSIFWYCGRNKIFFHWMSSCTEGCHPPKVIFHGRSSSTEGRLLPKVVFHWISSSTKGHHSLKVIFLQRSSSINHNTLVDLIFERIVNIPNLSLLPCLEVA